MLRQNLIFTGRAPSYRFFRRCDHANVFCNVIPCARVAVVFMETNVKNLAPKKPTCTGKMCDGFYIADIRNTDIFIVM